MPFPPSQGQDDPVTARKKKQRSDAEAAVTGKPSAPAPQAPPPAQAPPAMSHTEPDGDEGQTGFVCPGCGMSYELVPKAPPAMEPPIAPPEHQSPPSQAY